MKRVKGFNERLKGEVSPSLRPDMQRREILSHPCNRLAKTVEARFLASLHIRPSLPPRAGARVVVMFGYRHGKIFHHPRLPPQRPGKPDVLIETMVSSHERDSLQPIVISRTLV